MRVLFTSTQGAGHFQPLLPFIDGCLRLGHEIHVVVPPALAETLASSGFPYTLGADPPPEELGPIWERVPQAAPADAERIVLCEIFGRLKTEGMLPEVRRVADEWGPDMVIRETQEYAGAVVADERGLPHARVAVSLARGEAIILPQAAPAIDAFRAGLSERIAETTYLTCFPASLDASPFARTARVRDPVARISGEPLPPWWRGDDAPLVYVTFGSVLGGMANGAAAFDVVLEAVAELEARVLLTTGRAVDPAGLGARPAHVHVERWIPQEAVLGHAAAVVCHGGSGTTIGTLAAGVPLVVVPLFADQPLNAAAVAEAGAGIDVPPLAGAGAPIRTLIREDAPRIRGAIETVLADGSYREAAIRIAREVESADTVDSALAALLPR